MEFIVIAIVIGVLPAAIARSKGRNFFLWWIYGALLFIVALPHALLASTNTREIEWRALASGENRRCPHCAEIIKVEAKVCRYCGRDVTGTGS